MSGRAAGCTGAGCGWCRAGAGSWARAGPGQREHSSAAGIFCSRNLLRNHFSELFVFS